MGEVKSITAVHQRELNAYERTIERGVGSFLEVGNALKAIRDKKLYKLTHKTFELYVQQRWGWNRNRAYVLMESAETSENVSHAIQNPRQAVEVAKAPAELQPAVVEAATQKAAEENRKPTAKDFKEAREEICQPQAAVDSLEYEDCDTEPEPDAPTYDAKVIKAWTACDLRLGTLRHIVGTLTETEKQILKEWLG